MHHRHDEPDYFRRDLERGRRFPRDPNTMDMDRDPYPGEGGQDRYGRDPYSGRGMPPQGRFGGRTEDSWNVSSHGAPVHGYPEERQYRWDDRSRGGGYGREEYVPDTYLARSYGRNEYNRGDFERGGYGRREREYGQGRGYGGMRQPGRERPDMSYQGGGARDYDWQHRPYEGALGYWDYGGGRSREFFGREEEHPSDVDWEHHPWNPERSGRRPGLLQRLFGIGPKGYKRSDERIREDICERLVYSDDIDPSDVSIDVKDGKVTLEGTVPQRYMKYAIEDLVDDCAGVQDIENRIRVQRQQMSGRDASGSRPTEVFGYGMTGAQTGGMGETSSRSAESRNRTDA